jgi:hypothetical protein
MSDNQRQIPQRNLRQSQSQQPQRPPQGPQSGSISEEITRQLSLLKRQIDAEIKRDLAAMKDSIVREMRSYVDNKIDSEIASTRNKLSEDVNKQIVAANGGVSKDLVMSVANNAGQQVYKKIITDLNKTIVPKIEHLDLMMKYRDDDTHQLLNNYRYAVFEQHNPDAKMITDGKSLHISEHVNLFFNEND